MPDLREQYYNLVSGSNTKAKVDSNKAKCLAMLPWPEVTTTLFANINTSLAFKGFKL